MTSLAFGLFGLAIAFLGASRLRGPGTLTIWFACAAAALTVFLAQPRSFVEVALWAVTAGGLCLLVRGRTAADETLVFAAIAGWLIGAVAPHVGASLDQVSSLPDRVPGVLVLVVAMATGLAFGSIATAALAALSCALSLGLLVPAMPAALLVGLLLAAAAMSARAFRPAVLCLLLVPVTATIGGSS